MMKTVCFALLLAGCGAEPGLKAGDGSDEIADGEGITRETRSGPVTAMVTVRPAKPKLGDMMLLTLDVSAAAGVEVTMPTRQEALGQFKIFRPKESQEILDDGSQKFVHSYQMQAPASGKTRVPQLRIVFSDRRDEKSPSLNTELLTEELSIDVASVLPSDADTALANPLTLLNENVGPGPLKKWGGGLALGACAILCGVVGWFVLRRRRQVEAAEPPLHRAIRRLQGLESKGLPADNEVDPWYVELSDIVRQYLEGQFQLRAPELTTEEFLRVAKRSDRLSVAQKSMLAEFLVHCDRVKFAGYRPDIDEMGRVLQRARAFVDETGDRANQVESQTEAAA